ncbi:MAG: hypothetical protein CMJ84_01625 [Planctomycetes bacterium]|nr:hypothetical protein [Planctomycetota bacterium]
MGVRRPGDEGRRLLCSPGERCVHGAALRFPTRTPRAPISRAPRALQTLRSLALPTVLLALVACSSLPGFAEDPRPRVRGPLPARNQHPLALTQISLRPRRPLTTPRGDATLAVGVSYSSIEEIGSIDEQAVSFDGELLRIDSRLRYGLSGRSDLEVELPLLFTTSGFLDAFIESWHELLTLPGGGRTYVEDDQWQMTISDGDDVLFELEEDRLALGDLALIYTSLFQEEGKRVPAMAWRVGVELPTGSESAGFGNGALDFGLGLAGEKNLGRVTSTFGLAWRMPGQSEGFCASSAHELENAIDLQLGGEYRWNDSLSLLGQLIWSGPMMSSIPVEEIDQEILDLGLGLAWDTGEESRLSFSFHEDLVAATGPDFSLLVSWHRDF